MTAPATTGRFPTLEGLRALSALGVVVYHAGSLTNVTLGPGAADNDLGPWVQHLNVGVSVFFVLSGFLLFRPFVLAHLRDQPSPAAGPYLIRRLVRIFPAYWAALFVSTRLLDLNLGDWWGHVRFYGLLQIYWGDTVLGGLVQAWSLCTELSFYLVLPLWAAAMRRAGGTLQQRVRAHAIALAGWYVLGIVVRAWLRSGDHAVGYATLPANADLFAIGMALALASAYGEVRARPLGGLARTLGDQPAMAWLAAGCCYVGAVSLRYPYGFNPATVSQEVIRQLLFGAIAALVVAPGVFGAQDRGGVRRFLRWRPLVAVGVISYGLYLWHLTFLELLVEPGTFPAPAAFVPLIVVALPPTLVVAAGSWLLIERPTMRRVRRAPRGSD